MTDPYEVLGITRSASNDEIKKAYRKMSRIYHPDANIDNPDKDQAEEKFKQVQAAYKQIMDEREGKTSYGSAYSGGSWYQNVYGEQSASGESEEAAHLRAAANYINNGYYEQAMNVLENLSSRPAEWYFLHAMCHSAMGNQINALEDAETAVGMDPDNFQYQALLSRLQGGSSWYNTMSTGYGFNREAGNLSDCCCRCLAWSVFCNCCCGGSACPGIFLCC